MTILQRTKQNYPESFLLRLFWRNEKFDYIVLLQPTSPLRNAHHVDQAIELLLEKEADAVISVCEMEHSLLWSNTLPKNGSIGIFYATRSKTNGVRIWNRITV